MYCQHYEFIEDLQIKAIAFQLLTNLGPLSLAGLAGGLLKRKMLGETKMSHTDQMLLTCRKDFVI